MFSDAFPLSLPVCCLRACTCAVRNDFARPTVHARNLFHISAAMYDAWSVYDEVATPWLLGRDDLICPFDELAMSSTLKNRTAVDRIETISFAAMRIILHRFAVSFCACDTADFATFCQFQYAPMLVLFIANILKVPAADVVFMSRNHQEPMQSRRTCRQRWRASGLTACTRWKHPTGPVRRLATILRRATSASASWMGPTRKTATKIPSTSRSVQPEETGTSHGLLS